MKKIICIFSILFLFTLSCSDMVSEVSNPEGTGDGGGGPATWDSAKWDQSSWND